MNGLPESLQVLSVEGVSSVYAAGFMLTVAAWALGLKIAVAIGLIKKV